MSQNLIPLITLLSPALFAAIALASWFQPGSRPKQIIALSKTTTLLSLISVGLSCFYGFQEGLIESSFIGFKEIGWSIRIDSLSLVMLGMIALLGFIIVKFSINYLDGDPRQGAFLGRLAATIASVQLLVLSGNLGLLFLSWVLTSISLHRLLIFYHERPGAQIVAKKKFILARLGDASLLIALILLYKQYGTGNLELIFSTIKSGFQTENTPVLLELAALFLAIAAILKSAQFPTHGWLIEVMETPTPVSSLLHAGLLNAGPFLIIRMAFVMDASTLAPIVLMSIGGFTALFASVVYLTQPSVKTALGYSSVGHMGFSLLVCGLGVYPAALLHLVAHSFYKAHAFLSSGSVIEALRSTKVIKMPPRTKPLKIAFGIVLAVLLYTGFAILWGINLENELSLLAIGAVIVLGLSRLFTSALASNWNVKLLAQATLMAFIVTVAFFSLESGTHYLIKTEVPALTRPDFSKIILGGIILLAFGLTVFVQILAPQLEMKPAYQRIAIHIRNGFYANAWFDRFVNALHVHSIESKQTITAPKLSKVTSEDSEVKELEEQLA
ncbi:proton-conducting transporter membrane subunit [Algoriphagus sp. CAU 1675]|uniref:proton-conducting transporter transmembrane domain-containing protein n=1 Tax=Algoriphagus sp. CAU 1675 TaxID=3032597 RepID=UPI0023DAD534|nr:proton-conducting transporter membrane subunit [Algoriphagus sp. CAU 1675]MDF2159102.1 proton-conducting transporter membrane subunit [Algoriphagus sp. CAU 1675]